MSRTNPNTYGEGNGKVTATSDTIVTKDISVSCDGGEYAGHPKVFLDLEKNGQASCPYCGQCFVLDEAHAHA